MARPTKYKREYCENVIALMREGDSIAVVASHLGIAKSTLYEWMKVHEEFSDAIKEGVYLSQAWWETEARKPALGEAAVARIGCAL